MIDRFILAENMRAVWKNKSGHRNQLKKQFLLILLECSKYHDQTQTLEVFSLHMMYQRVAIKKKKHSA